MLVHLITTSKLIATLIGGVGSLLFHLTTSKRNIIASIISKFTRYLLTTMDVSIDDEDSLLTELSTIDVGTSEDGTHYLFD